MNTINWVQAKNNQKKILKNLKQSLAIILFYLHRDDIQTNQLPKLWLVTLKELYNHREASFIPAIAERKDNDIVFYYEIVNETICKINNNEEIGKFIQSICLHEMMHIIFQHKSDTKENRELAEMAVNMWMATSVPNFQEIFIKYMPLVDEICKKYKKE